MGKKRKAAASAAPRRKRCKVTDGSQHSEIVSSSKHPVLSVYYGRVVTLRNYLIEALSCDTHRYRRAITRLKENEISLSKTITSSVDVKSQGQIKQILDTTLVGFAHGASPERSVQARDLIQFSQQLQSSTNEPSTIASDRDPDSRLQIEVVNFVIWLLLRNGKHQHLLAQGFSRASAPGGHNGLPLSIGAGLPGVVCLYPNDCVATLASGSWCALLQWIGRGGDMAMVNLLVNHAVFLPVDHAGIQTPANYYQLSGMPLSNIAMATRVMPIIQDTEAKSLPHGRKSHVPARTTDDPQRRLSDIQIVRHRMFYARAALNGKGNVRLGLRHIHVLNRFPDVSSYEQTVHVAKYIFPRQFRLHNAFTSRTDGRETSHKFKDYTLREQEITSAQHLGKHNKSWLPKRLRGGAVAFVELIRARHLHLKYVELLRKYCPVEGPCSCMSQHLRDAGDARGKARSSATQRPACSCAKTACETGNVVRFVQAAVTHLIGDPGLGGPSNTGSLMKAIERFILARKFETTTMHEIMQGVKVTAVPWLAPDNTTCHKISLSNLNKRKELLAEFLYWLFDSFMIALIRTNFYVTESNGDKNHLYFYRQDVWRHATESSVFDLKHSIFEELRPPVARRMFMTKSLAYGQVRLLPKKTTFRPITNLKKRAEYMQNGRRLLGKSTNSLLGPAFKVLNYELSRRPRHLGSSLTSVSHIQSKLSTYKQRLLSLDLQAQPMYMVKVDVQSCFDTIPPERVLPMLEQLLNFDLYSISGTAQIRAPKLLPRKGHIMLQPCVKFDSVGKAAKQIVHVADQASAALAAVHGGAVYVGNANLQTRTKANLIDLLTEHLQSNVVKLGKKFYLQRNGIPQGSVISSLLCNVFYGRLDSGELRFTDTDSTVLMRLVDDFLLITTDKSVATKFLDTMHRGIPDFGIKVKAEKTLTNFSASIHGRPLSRCASTHFPYCGILINTSTLDITKDPGRTTLRGIANSLSVDTTSQPGQSFRQKSLNALRIQLHPFLFHTGHNARHAVVRNLYDTLCSAALRMLAYAHCLPARSSGSGSGRLPASLVIQTLGDLLQLTHRVLRRKAAGAAAASQFECRLSKALMWCVGLRAFVRVLRARQTGYAAVLAWCEREAVVHVAKIARGDGELLARVEREYEPPKRN